MDVAEFDAWRDEYCQMDYAAQREFYDRVAVDHPCQRAFDFESFAKFFRLYASRARVLEFGGWKGELAEAILGLSPSAQISKWDNFEISYLAVSQTVCRDVRYVAAVHDQFVWNINLPDADVLVMSHFIEHIRMCHLSILLSRLPPSIRWLLVQAPLPEKAEDIDWSGYHGSHILEVGWEELTAYMRFFGLKEDMAHRRGNFRVFGCVEQDDQYILPCGYPAFHLLKVCPAIIGSYLENPSSC